MYQIIQLGQNLINRQTVDTVNARELHNFLESKQDFSTWIKSRIEKYGFDEGQDFIRVDATPQKKMERKIQQLADGKAALITS
jgi:phage anti-repressor protein